MTLMTEQPTSTANSPSMVANEVSIDLHPSSDQLPLNQLVQPSKSRPVFDYDADLLKLCQVYLKEKNHHGLALLSRQKGLPPFLRFKIWPVLLKYHPFVLNPFLQPDSIDDEVVTKNSDTSSISSSNSNTGGTPSSTTKEEDLSSKADDLLQQEIRKDLRKYIQRLSFNKEKLLSETEMMIFDTLEHSILKFIKKWGRIIKYDKAMAWLALGLAEWMPAIPKTPWVLVGRNITSTDRCYKSVFDDYQEFIDLHEGMNETLKELVEDETISNMKFKDVFERLTLVLLHSPEKSENKSNDPSNNFNKQKINKSTLPVHGGSIEERVSFFIYLLRKLLPELSTYFQEEQILNKFGSHDDEWLIWWLKWSGSKVWSRVDRGRIWDLMLGYKQDDGNYSKKLNKLKLDSYYLNILGPDIFWSAIDISNKEENEGFNDFNSSSTNTSTRTSTSSSSYVTNMGDHSAQPLHKANSFKDLIQELTVHQDESSSTTSKQTQHVSTHTPSRRSSSASSSSTCSSSEVPVSRLDPHIELIFISLAILKSKEHTLVELDQHEIRQYLSKLPSKSYNPSNKYKQHILNRQKEKEKEENKTDVAIQLSEMDLNWQKLSSPSSVAESNGSNLQHYKVNYIDNVINEAGELWRKWLWREMMEDE
ncbi:hypothetical protein CAAN1_19S01288 [[Candida] anglica]|uniref:Rab-GAP TBC domain-containing protein n=1 Tax=[Candida] anglica TaxID=148631 RepID=A0ABP0E771_9ASCO